MKFAEPHNMSWVLGLDLAANPAAYLHMKFQRGSASPMVTDDYQRFLRRGEYRLRKPINIKLPSHWLGSPHDEGNSLP
jgi:hypothetical protein